MAQLLTCRKALITRALYEMTKLGKAYGANPLTFLGLAGVGDLLLTCTSPLSRNYTVGRRLAAGESIEHIVATLGSVAEGVQTSKGLQSLINDIGLDLPIANAVSKYHSPEGTPLNSFGCIRFTKFYTRVRINPLFGFKLMTSFSCRQGREGTSKVSHGITTGCRARPSGRCFEPWETCSAVAREAGDSLGAVLVHVDYKMS